MDEQATEIRFFDASSRIGRVRYLAYPWGILLLILPAAILAGIFFAMQLGFLSVLLFIAIEVFALVMSGVFIVRRLHDFGWIGWWSLIYWALQVWSVVLTFHSAFTTPFAPQPLGNYVPTLCIFLFFLVMVLVPGTQGVNRFGPLPPPNSTWVLVGAWMWLVVIVLGGILAAIAIPAYQDFLARTQTGEAIALADKAGSSAVEYYRQNKTWPTDFTAYNQTNDDGFAGRYTGTIDVDPGTDGSFRVVATMKSLGVNEAVAGKTIEVWYTPDDRAWHCGPGGARPIEKRYLPASCRETGAP